MHYVIVLLLRSYGEISMSLCGGLADSGPSEDNFLQHLVSHNDLVRDPKLIENPNLVVRLNGKYYNWRTAGPLIMSLVIFQKPLPQVRSMLHTINLTVTGSYIDINITNHLKCFGTTVNID